MNAHGERDVSARMSVMSPAASRILEGLLPIMQHAGIRKITVRITVVGGLRKISGVAEYICDVPTSIREYGDVVKDSIAEVVASLGFLSVEIQATSEEISELSGFYSQLDAMYKSARFTNMCQISEAAAAEANAKSADEAGPEEAEPEEAPSEVESGKKEKKTKSKDK
jgi:hypothetical protein